MCVWGPTLCVVGIFNESPLEKTNFSFMNSYQLDIASWLGVGDCVCFSLSVLGPRLAWTCAAPMDAARVSGFICPSVLLYLEGPVSLASTTPTGFYNLFTSSSERFPES